jgi:hypothetical protein
MSYYNGPTIVTNGLVMYVDAGNKKSYPGSGTAWGDLSGLANNGTLTGGPTYSSANGGGIAFDGTDDYVAGPTFTGLGSSNRTVDVWFQIRSLSLSGSERILSLVTDDTSTDTPALTIGYNTSLSSLSAGFGGSPYNGYVFNLSFTLSTWINLTATITGNNIVAYKDSISVGTATNSGTVGSNPILYLGRYNNFYSQYGDIIISNVKIYNRALSPNEVLQNYNATKTRFGL